MEEIFTNIYKHNLWGGSESVSGCGSSLRETKNLIRILPSLIKNLQVRTMLDAPCGDFNWMKEIHKNVESYIGVDVVEDLINKNKENYSSSNIQFYHCDITKDPLPQAELILNRDCFVHFCFEDIKLAIRNMKTSGSRYILTTTFSNINSNRDIKTGGWHPINLLIEPFNFPDPILNINETSRKGKGQYSAKSLGLWELKQLSY